MLLKECQATKRYCLKTKTLIQLRRTCQKSWQSRLHADGYAGCLGVFADLPLMVVMIIMVVMVVIMLFWRQ